MKVCSHEYCQLHCTVQVVAKKMNRGKLLFYHYIALWFWLSHYNCFLEASLSYFWNGNNCGLPAYCMINVAVYFWTDITVKFTGIVRKALYTLARDLVLVRALMLCYTGTYSNWREDRPLNRPAGRSLILLP